MSVTISMPEPYTDAERDEIIASEAAKGREVVSFGVDWGARSYVTRLNQKGYEDEIKRLTEENAKLKSALVWAENELCHATDETGCCQPWCDSCKAIRDNNTWREWRNLEYSPVRDALEQS